MSTILDIIRYGSFISGKDGDGVSGGTQNYIEFNDNLETIGEAAFIERTDLSSLSLSSVKSVGGAAFLNSSLTTVSLPETEEIGGECFRNCASLTSINIPKVKNIENTAFENCTMLREINLPNIETIDWGAFSGCSALEKVTLGNAGLTTARFAFWLCDNLTAVIITDTNKVLNISDHFAAFSEGCPILTGTGRIYVPASMWDAYATAYEEQIVMFRKIEDYPEICS